MAARQEGHGRFHDTRILAAQAAAAFRAHAVTVLVVASAIILTPTVILGLLEHWLGGEDPTGSAVVVTLVAAVVAAVLATFGNTFLAGLLDRLAGQQVRGHRFEGLEHTLRTLPYGRLLLADVVVSMLVAVGTVLLFIPGLIAYTLLALVGPLIIIEELSVRGAIRRSVRLVRQDFWLVALTVTAVSTLEGSLEAALAHSALARHLPGELCIAFVLGVVLGSFAALLKVCAAYELLARESMKNARLPPATAG